MDQTHYQFTVNDARGQVSAVLQRCPDAAMARLVLGHGAGANMFHSHMQNLADALGAVGIETLRYQFPYMEAGGGRTDSLEVCLDTIRGALALSEQLSGPATVLLGGHSFGGRMSSHYAAQETANIAGLIYFSFPLHPAGKPDIKRASHLVDIQQPQLFLSGTRDKLAELELLEPVVSKLTRAQLHKLDTADHGFKILKRTRVASESVYEESARVAAEFCQSL
ncbi:MAG: alpha/beta fold hydrolase [Pseudomonadales bacterium]